MHILFYLDPNSGSILIQILAAVFLGGAAAVGMYWSKFKELFKGKKNKPVDDEGEEASSEPDETN
jgi:hypothetical protein